MESRLSILKETRQNIFFLMYVVMTAFISIECNCFVEVTDSQMWETQQLIIYFQILVSAFIIGLAP